MLREAEVHLVADKDLTLKDVEVILSVIECLQRRKEEKRNALVDLSVHEPAGLVS